MSFRTRVLLAMLPLAVLPLALFAWVIRGRLDDRLAEQYAESMVAAADAVRADVEAASVQLGEAVSAVRVALDGANRFRAAVLGASAVDRPYLLDLPGELMAQSGLDVLRIQDADGRILASGHFRNEFDRVDTTLAVTAASAGPMPFVATVAVPGGELTALLRAATLLVRDQTFTIIGGVEIDGAFVDGLFHDPYARVVLETPDRRPESRADEAMRRYAGEIETGRAIALPYATGDSAYFTIQATNAPIEALRSDIDGWFVWLLAAAALLALLLALWSASRVSRPLAELSRRTSSIDLDRLDVDFETERGDEIGSLSRMLGALQRRLRSSAARLREAERRAAVGEVARQVNHDVRNGLTPIRNVVEHLSQLARDKPDELPAVFLDRQRTLDASIEYLHGLAANYARLSPKLERRPCDVNEIVREVTRGAAESDQTRIRERLAPRLPPVIGDPVALRRVIENLVTNAVESMFETGGIVIVTSGLTTGDDPRVRIVVGDTGRGMAREEMARVFDHFYTTKENGTGLGLSIVRRLIGDLGGTIRFESEPGRGTRVVIDLPPASEPESNEAVAAHGDSPSRGRGERDAIHAARPDSATHRDEPAAR